MTRVEGLWLFAATAALSCLLTWGALAHARRLDLLAHPEERSSHTVPTPSGTGVGLAAAIVVALLFVMFQFKEPEALWLVGGVLCLSAAGFCDDARALRPGVKFGVVLAAAWFSCRVGLVHGVELPGLAELPFAWLALPLTLFWLVGFTNAFNFMDGTNGIAGLTAVVTGAALAVFGLRAGDTILMSLGLVTAGASIGYLPWNFPKARLFMGDAGSLPLGLLVASGIARAAGTGALPFAAGVLLVGPFVFDTTFTLIRRALRGERLSEAHREHLYQRFARLAGGHEPSALLFAILASGCAVLGLEYASRGTLGQVLSLLGPLVAMLLFAGLVTALERRRDA